VLRPRTGALQEFLVCFAASCVFVGGANNRTPFDVAAFSTPCYQSVEFTNVMTRHLHSVLLLSCSVIATTGFAAAPVESGFTYFRSDGGVAGAAAGPLPDDFDAPGRCVEDPD